jgi:hypothetical protein
VCLGRDSIGSSSIVGDMRWAGSFGVDADFIAHGHCSVEFIKIKDIEVQNTVFLICLMYMSLSSDSLCLWMLLKKKIFPKILSPTQPLFSLSRHFCTYYTVDH